LHAAEHSANIACVMTGAIHAVTRVVRDERHRVVPKCVSHVNRVVRMIAHDHVITSMREA
jgi:hypothetical protein